jgi:ABC-type bacteriocin/lantibiotic exporter with double-glycine peptidase domain
MPSNLLPDIPPLPVPHHVQAGPSDCLAACAAMALAYYGRSTPYGKLLRLLNIGPIGAPRRNILNLSRLRGVTVIYREATLPIAAQYLRAGLPVIAFVDTGELGYWSSTTNHALVLIGIEKDDVLVNDPAVMDAPMRVPNGEFDLAWLNADNACAVISVMRP